MGRGFVVERRRVRQRRSRRSRRRRRRGPGFHAASSFRFWRAAPGGLRPKVWRRRDVPSATFTARRARPPARHGCSTTSTRWARPARRPPSAAPAALPAALPLATPVAGAAATAAASAHGTAHTARWFRRRRPDLRLLGLHRLRPVCRGLPCRGPRAAAGDGLRAGRVGPAAVGRASLACVLKATAPWHAPRRRSSAAGRRWFDGRGVRHTIEASAGGAGHGGKEPVT